MAFVGVLSHTPSSTHQPKPMTAILDTIHDQSNLQTKYTTVNEDGYTPSTRQHIEGGEAEGHTGRGHRLAT